MTTEELIRQLKQDINEVYLSGGNIFWNSYIDNTKAEYRYAFYGGHWTDDAFKPNSVIVPKGARFMFQNSSITKITKEQVDFSQATDLRDCFNGSAITELDFNSTGCTNTSNLSNIFKDCSNLRVLNWEGTIKGNLDLSDCINLTLSSIESVLKACNGTGTGLTITLPEYCEGGTVDTYDMCCGGDSEELMVVYAQANIAGYTFAFN